MWFKIIISIAMNTWNSSHLVNSLTLSNLVFTDMITCVWFYLFFIIYEYQDVLSILFTLSYMWEK
jgi:hypothetical protein